MSRSIKVLEGFYRRILGRDPSIQLFHYSFNSFRCSLVNLYFQDCNTKNTKKAISLSPFFLVPPPLPPPSPSVFYPLCQFDIGPLAASSIVIIDVMYFEKYIYIYIVYIRGYRENAIINYGCRVNIPV